MEFTSVGLLVKLNVSIEDKKDPKYDSIVKEVKNLNGSYVTIGVHEDAGSYPTGEAVLDVALWNEFGTDHIPERSFFRSAIDGNDSLINQWREESLEKVLLGQWTAQKALESVGFKIQVLIQNKIQSDVPPPNAPSTVEKKLRDGVAPRTLQNTRLMLRSVTYKVVMK